MPVADTLTIVPPSPKPWRKRPTRAAVREAWALFPRMADVLPPGKSGSVEIRHFTVTPEERRAKRAERGEDWGTGTFCQLDIEGVGWMYDVLQERLWNLEAVRRARGDVLIAGLGLGMILHPILAKPEVRSVRVLENSPDVAALVLPSLDGAAGREKLTLEMADAYRWRPREDQRFDTIWLDVIPFYMYDRQFVDLAEMMEKRYRPWLREGRASWIGHWAFMEVLEDLIGRAYAREKE